MSTSGSIQHSLYISHASPDARIARELSDALERIGWSCWLAPRDVVPGASYGDSISDAIVSSKAVIVMVSSNSNASAHVALEMGLVVSQDIPIIAYKIENVACSLPMKSLLASRDGVDGFDGHVDQHAVKLADILRGILPGDVPATTHAERAPAERQDKSKGYVFISYVRVDSDVVQKLRKVFESKRYGYWDYVVGNRDYHGCLYRELEERIDGAAAFMTVVSDDWRDSDWVASEFIYAREAKIPIFVIQAKKLKRPLPILLNLQTRIDMSLDFEKGAETLAEELSKKGL